ncbi:hypothetical protein M413DRAFT_449023 [Hebeloma cylindrosporum]|uniref:Ribosome recycling factor domain-containing protein n=1 Tax=Hebeloma cylindrosporum TaxID=76867 RepID=A0A0C3BJ15_HEBCY|nr:hypothetical protein M413DRAFT_449023 [Hebeloma cylindrosporum h7]
MLSQLLLRNTRLSLVRATSRSSTTQLSSSILHNRLQHELHRTHHRGYASKNKVKVKSTSTLVPGSKQPITDPAAQQEYTKADKAMAASVAWFKKECAALETRASGYARPGMISTVRVKIPEQPDMRLEELATIGVRDGTTFLVTLYDPQNIKHVESALYDSGIPGVVPHRQDSRTIKIPMPRPTVQARLEIFASAKKQAEDIRVQIRKQHTASLKRGKFEKHSIELEEFQKLTDRHIQEADKILADLQKATASSK